MSEAVPGAARRLFLLGFLTLFLELALIRYLAGTIWNLGYFPNLVLLAVFVGMGAGFVLHDRLGDRTSRALYGAVPLATLGLALLVEVVRPSVPGFGSSSGSLGGELFFTGVPTGTRQGALPFLLWFGGVTALFALLAQRTATYFRLFPPLRAYTLDIAGSCAGILAFMAASALELPASVWFLAGAGLCASADVGAVSRRLARALPLVALAALAERQDVRLTADPGFAGTRETRWSPYQKVEYSETPQWRALFVNGIAHQFMQPREAILRSYYMVPFRHRAARGLPAGRVLVIGAGSGNDVAAALLAAAERVDAVEIDPVIARLGRRRHPVRPYADPRVRLIVDDGRAVLTRSRERYDVIVFALTDSLVKVSPMAQLRLENYLYTQESLRRAYDLLDPRGQMVVYNYYRVPWLVEKYRLALQAATGKPPLTVHQEAGGFAMMLTGPDTPPGPVPPPSPEVLEVARDDWPFPYLRHRGVPRLYAGALGLMAALVALFALVLHRLERRSGGPVAPARMKAAFVLMGTAFLLLETKGVIQFSLLFGTTWLNSSLVFLAVLVLVLAANATAARVRHPLALAAACGLLLLSCAAALVVPLGLLLELERPLSRFVGAALLIFAPIYFANLVFSVAFRGQRMAAHLFGWNLLGAALGGLLEYASMSVGYRALSVLVAVLYAASAALVVRERRAPASAEEAA